MIGSLFGTAYLSLANLPTEHLGSFESLATKVAAESIPDEFVFVGSLKDKTEAKEIAKPVIKQAAEKKQAEAVKKASYSDWSVGVPIESEIPHRGTTEADVYNRILAYAEGGLL